jgi:glutamate:GABA antiporter
MQPAEPPVTEHDLKRELGLWDLVFTQILFIIGLGWVGAAAKLGSSHVTFWLLAVLLFYIPSAIVVMHLSRRMPFEGGLYEWAKLGFNDHLGFLVGWNLWLYAMVLMSEVGVQAATNISYATGVEWVAESKWSIALGSLIILGGLAALSTVGLGAGKWLHSAGGFTMVLILTAMIALPAVAWARGVKPMTTPFLLEMPQMTLFNLNILGKMGFAALGGFEYVAIFAGESRDPARIIGRSVLISAPVIALLFILGTGSVLFYVPMNSIDLVSPVSQVLAIATKPFGVGAQIAGAVIMAVLGMRIAQASLNFSATARLPMVAGWDHLLPRWFTRLHPRNKTPVNSILFVGAATLTCSLVGMTGVARQEAYQLFNNASGIFYALTYLAMFALPFALKDVPMGVRVASASGFLMTLLYIALSIFPIVDVGSSALFTSKICGVIVLGNLAGIAIFQLARRAEKPVLAADERG